MQRIVNNEHLNLNNFIQQSRIINTERKSLLIVIGMEIEITHCAVLCNRQSHISWPLCVFATLSALISIHKSQ